MLSARKHVEALGEDLTAEEFLEAVSNCNDPIIELADNVDPAN